MTPLEEIAQLIHDKGLGDYRADGSAGGNIFLGIMPAAPDTAISVANYQGREASVRLGYDEPNFQVRVRGPAADFRIALRLAQDVYDKLHGLGSFYLSGGTRLVLLSGSQSGPIPLGQDKNGRFEHTVNFRADLRRPTNNRE